jgi:hypothetical protein
VSGVGPPSTLRRDLIFLVSIISTLGGAIYFVGQMKREVEVDTAAIRAIEQHLTVLNDRVYTAIERGSLINARQDEQVVNLDRRVGAVETGYTAQREVMLNFQQRLAGLERESAGTAKLVVDLQALTQKHMEMTGRLLDQSRYSNGKEH